MTSENGGGAGSVEPVFHERLEVLPPTSVLDLFDGEMPDMGGISLKENERSQHTLIKKFPEAYARRTIRPYRVAGSEDDEILVVCPPMRGMEVQVAFYYGAPHRLYGIEYGDTQGDWQVLYEEKNADLLGKHREHIPGWSHFERDRLPVMNHIRDVRDGTRPEYEYIHPVMRFGRDGETREYGWKLDGFSPGTNAGERLFLPSLGPLVVAMYSRGEVNTWGTELTFDLQRPTQRIGGMFMAPAQSVALSIAKRDSLLRTPFMDRLRSHTGMDQARGV